MYVGFLTNYIFPPLLDCLLLKNLSTNETNVILLQLLTLFSLEIIKIPNLGLIYLFFKF